jgi:soluble lytic murein transglycosylase-like protein
VADARRVTPGHVCSTGDLVLDGLVREAGARYGVDPCFVIAVMSAESSYSRYAVSPKGACGYMQLMPDTAKRFGVQNIMDPTENIHGGVKYLRELLTMFNGNTELAVAAYNAGENAVIRSGNRIPPYAETASYVPKVLDFYRKFQSRKG